MPNVTVIPPGQVDRGGLDESVNRLANIATQIQEQKKQEALQTIQTFEHAMTSGIPVGEKMYKNFERAMNTLGAPLPKNPADWDNAIKGLTSQGSGQATPNQAAAMGGAMQGDRGGAQAGNPISRSAESQAPPGGKQQASAIPTQALQSIVANGPQQQLSIGQTPEGKPMVMGATQQVNVTPDSAEQQMIPGSNNPEWQPPQWIANKQIAQQERARGEEMQRQRDMEADKLSMDMMKGKILTPGQYGAVLARYGITPTPEQIGVLGMTPKEYKDMKEMNIGYETPTIREARIGNLKTSLINGGKLVDGLDNPADADRAADMIARGIDPRSADIKMKPNLRQTLQIGELRQKNLAEGMDWQTASQVALVEANGGDASKMVPATFQTVQQLQRDAYKAQTKLQTEQAKVVGFEAETGRMAAVTKQKELDVNMAKSQADIMEAVTKANTEEQKTAVSKMDMAIQGFDKGVVDKQFLNQAIKDFGSAMGWKVSQRENLYQTVIGAFGADAILDISRPGADASAMDKITGKMPEGAPPNPLFNNPASGRTVGQPTTPVAPQKIPSIQELGIQIPNVAKGL
jgi:hypothetical protein